MSNKNNNLIIFSLAVFVLSASLVVSLPKTADAYYTTADYQVSEYYAGTNGSYTPSTTTNTKNNPTPVIISLSPNSAITGSPARNVTITGTGFMPNSVAKFNGSDRATTYVDSRHLIMELTAEDMKGKGKYLVNVWNPAPGGGYSNTVFFTLNPATVTKATTKKATTTKKTTAVTKAVSTEPAVTCTGNQTTENNDSESEDKETLLSASVIGSGGDFMPDTLLEWLILFIFILLGVILWRKLYISDREKNAPLKHA